MLAAAVALQLVFVHANGRVALERKPGDASYVLFEKGHEPSRTPDGKAVFYRTNEGIVRAEIDGGARALWRAGNLRSPRVSPVMMTVWLTDSGGLPSSVLFWTR